MTLFSRQKMKKLEKYYKAIETLNAIDEAAAKRALEKTGLY